MYWMTTIMAAVLVLGCSPAPAGQSAGLSDAADTTVLASDTVPPAALARQLGTTEGDILPAGYTTDYIMGKFDPAQHPDFVVVDARYTDGGQTYYLHRDAYAEFERMHAAAAKDNVPLIIVSATRNFARQRTIWEAKWTGQRLLEGKEKAPEAYPDPQARAQAILRWSSMPGSSRHHWGTDIDLNNLTNEYFATGQGQRIYDWLVQHGHEYHFCQPYSAKGKDRPHGYNEEKWHWSYLPLAAPLTALARQALRDSMITGFQGAETAVQIGVVQQYVLGINPACQPK